MLAPHWLDNVFCVPENAATELMKAERFQVALTKAQAAFLEAQEFQKKNPKVVGSSPSQQARVAFLDAITSN